MSPQGSTTRIALLRRERPRSRFVRWSVVVLAGVVAASWLSGEIEVAGLLARPVDWWNPFAWIELWWSDGPLVEQRRENLERFLGRDAMPAPLRRDGFSWGGLFDWAAGVVRDPGLDAALATLWISILAIVLAGGFALLVQPLAARTLMTRDPFLFAGDGEAVSRGVAWRILTTVTRGVFVAMRAIPEYVWAFLFLAMLGPNAWPAVLALAIHNGGILGRLGSDTIENLEASPLRSLSALGARRRQLVAVALLPLGLPRFLLYFFYRFETCVREATVLGMLGVVSLGYAIQDARSRGRYDDMLLLVGLGVVIVLASDLVSYVARGWVRRAT